MGNSNLWHNVINGLGLLLAGTTAALIQSGCTTAASGSLDCSQSWINPEYTAIAVPALFGLKFIINIARDGVAGLVKPQPPVQK